MNPDSFFKDFVEENKGIIYKICRVYANDREELQDFVQEVTIQLWKSSQNFENRSKLSTWVYRVTLNVCLTLSRKNKRRVDTVGLLSTDYIDDTDNTEQEQISALYAAIRKLNDADKAITLLYLEDKSYQEIADILGITVSNVGVKITRVKSKLNDIING
ncbi:RNA polymerase sigma factor [Fulvivirga lutimaris]|uniref:RNA polymerase sigma factor n=1 Tax=Fulvivirga lutimaris TaxID=1819566 RepID=UPI0012BC8583|nr:sigma-70 family RNA polymerase sigma factor [Fulvivirga lutimaris]MTI41456.1 sigma-70 family RNA polymerase sigma factor [Fulvivirga lutimaris]